MTFIFTIFGLIFGLFSGLIFNNYTGTQAQASDIERKNDINSIYQKLEEHYNEYGEYPTRDELLLNSEENLPGLDPEALVDPNGKRINNGDYAYLPDDCTAIGCGKYVLSAKLDDGSEFTKQSLN